MKPKSPEVSWSLLKSPEVSWLSLGSYGEKRAPARAGVGVIGNLTPASGPDRTWQDLPKFWNRHLQNTQETRDVVKHHETSMKYPWNIHETSMSPLGAAQMTLLLGLCKMPSICQVYEDNSAGFFRTCRIFSRRSKSALKGFHWSFNLFMIFPDDLATSEWDCSILLQISFHARASRSATVRSRWVSSSAETSKVHLKVDQTRTISWPWWAGKDCNVYKTPLLRKQNTKREDQGHSRA